MSVETVSGAGDGLARVQARISQLQSLLGTQPTGGVLGGTDLPPATSDVSGANGKSFAAALATVDGGDALSNLLSGNGSGATVGSGPDGLTGTNGLDGLGGLNGLNGLNGLGGLTGRTGTAATGAGAVQLALTYAGVPYRWGGTDPATGLDCSGLTQLVLGKLGVSLPRTAAQQARVGTPVASLADARPGDLLFFGSPVHHVGIYAGGGKMVDAPHKGATVGLHKVWGTPSAIRRVLPSAAPAGGTGGVTGAGWRSRPYADLFAAAGKAYGVDPALLSAVARAESGYDPKAVSGAGARGLMQIVPSTAASLGVDPDVPAQAVNGAARLLAGYLKQYGGRTDLALAAYNAGPGAVQRYGGVPPFAETQTYVRRVVSYWRAG